MLKLCFRGALGQNLYLESLALTSPTFSAAMANLIPAVTFIFALFLGYDNHINLYFLIIFYYYYYYKIFNRGGKIHLNLSREYKTDSRQT